MHVLNVHFLMGTGTVLKANFGRILAENSKIEAFLELLLLGTLFKKIKKLEITENSTKMTKN